MHSHTFPRALLALALALCAPALAPAQEPDTRTVVPLPDNQPTSAPAYCLRLETGHSACSATVVATAKGRSLVLTNHHCFAHALRSEDGRTLTQYPATARFRSLDGKASWSARAVVGSPAADLALCVLDGEIAPATIDLSPVAPGDRVKHYGITSGPATGLVLPIPRGFGSQPTQLFRSTLTSIPGDSGAGIFRRDQLVAVNWGYWTSTKEQGGTPIRYALELWAASPELVRLFGAPPGPGAPKEPPPAPPKEPPPAPPAPPPVYVAPPVVCPPCPPCPRRPLLFPRLRGYR